MKKHRLGMLLTAMLMLALLSGPQLGGHIALASGTARFVAEPDIANIPRAFSYQGTLRLANGSLATGSYNITLRIYTTVVAGAALHTETFTSTVVRNGSFSVVVGDVTPISTTVFDNANLYLGITVAPDAEMLPRQRLFPVPWAMQAQEAKTATTLVKNAVIDGLIINKGATNDGALSLVSGGPGWGSGIRFINTTGNVTWGMYAGSDGAWSLVNEGGNQGIMRVDNGGPMTIYRNLNVNASTAIAGSQSVAGNQTVGGSFVAGSFIQSNNNIVAVGKIYALGGFNGFCRGSGPIDVRCDQDVAETFGTDQRTEPGDVVVFIPEDRSVPAVKLSGKPYEGAIVGVVSTSPGLVFDQGHTTLAGDSSKLITDKKTVVAMVGRVPTKFSLENGPIAVGDPLTSGSTPGTAMKATQAGQIIGYAMESSGAAGAVTSGKLLVWLQLGTYIPPQTLAALNKTATADVSEASETTVAELKAQVAALAAQVAQLQAGQ